MTQRVEFKTKGGASATGELVEPAAPAKAPAVVLVQEWWGLNDHVRSLANRLAAAGFLVLAPDLYHGKTTKDAQEAARMMQALDKRQALDEIAGAVQYLAAHARGNGRVGVIGFCMGGALSFAAAANIPELAAAVPFYGIPDASLVDYGKVRAPIQAHVAGRDEWVKPELVRAIKAQLDARNQPMEMHVYEDADHAFVNDTRPEVHNPTAAKLAWDRAVAFLHKHVHVG
jgi:carboxymethylenebutenolidase